MVTGGLQNENEGYSKSWISLRYDVIPVQSSATRFHSSSWLLFSFFVDWGENKGSQAGSGTEILERDTDSPQFQLLMTPGFWVPAGMWKPESSFCCSVTLFKLAQCNWNNILQLSDVFIVFLFLTKCSLRVFRFQFLQAFMLENYKHPHYFVLKMYVF